MVGGKGNPKHNLLSRKCDAKKIRIKRSQSAVCGVNSTSDVVVFVSVLSFFGAELTLSGTPGLWSSNNFIMRIFLFRPARVCVFMVLPLVKRGLYEGRVVRSV